MTNLHMMNEEHECPICSGKMTEAFYAQVLRKYNAKFEVCNHCGYLRAHNPHWLDEAYSSAIADADTGLVMRNFAISSKLAGVLYWILGERGKGIYLDAAGGYGMLTRLMRDFGIEFYWSDKYCQNHLVPGFEFKPEQRPCKAVTAIEVFEHLTDPITFIQETLAFSGAQTIIFTTELYSGKPPAPESWWYYAFATGQHIGFFQEKTLKILSEKVGLQFASANGIHFFSNQSINPKLLNLVTGRWFSRIAPWWVRRRLGSKTLTDHELMLNKIV
ncbi:methyltransferase domain-containing protein [Polynucleobacter rarus]|uniref:methyltransferase domain-containing protein n=1 Tax=Polynucleobacter rarus TaxID=556055 RepID=UPI000D3E2A87|nr:methyltransferase domain-containing protein [Polynucleobacter rarus]